MNLCIPFLLVLLGGVGTGAATIGTGLTQPRATGPLPPSAPPLADRPCTTDSQAARCLVTLKTKARLNPHMYLYRPRPPHAWMPKEAAVGAPAAEKQAF